MCMKQRNVAARACGPGCEERNCKASCAYMFAATILLRKRPAQPLPCSNGGNRKPPRLPPRRATAADDDSSKDSHKRQRAAESHSTSNSATPPLLRRAVAAFCAQYLQPIAGCTALLLVMVYCHGSDGRAYTDWHRVLSARWLNLLDEALSATLSVSLLLAVRERIGLRASSHGMCAALAPLYVAWAVTAWWSLDSFYANGLRRQQRAKWSRRRRPGATRFWHKSQTWLLQMRFGGQFLCTQNIVHPGLRTWWHARAHELAALTNKESSRAGVDDGVGDDGVSSDRVGSQGVSDDEDDGDVGVRSDGVD